MRTLFLAALFAACPGVLLVTGFLLNDNPQTLTKLKDELVSVEAKINAGRPTSESIEETVKAVVRIDTLNDRVAGAVELSSEPTDLSTVSSLSQSSKVASVTRAYLWFKQVEYDNLRDDRLRLIERIKGVKANLFRTLIARIGLLMVALFVLRFFLRKARWRIIPALFINPVPAGYCCKCHYELTGNQSGVCPECGTAVAAETHAATNLQS